MKLLLALVLSISCAGFAGSAAQRPPTRASPPPAATIRGPHTEIPTNCIKTQEADGSVLVTCDCEDCGHPEARDGLTPLPWSCRVVNHRMVCGYGNAEIDQRNAPL